MASESSKLRREKYITYSSARRCGVHLIHSPECGHYLETIGGPCVVRFAVGRGVGATLRHVGVVYCRRCHFEPQRHPRMIYAHQLVGLTDYEAFLRCALDAAWESIQTITQPRWCR